LVVKAASSATLKTFTVFGVVSAASKVALSAATCVVLTLPVSLAFHTLASVYYQ